ncbi:LysR family transcriptional regulator [Mesorhizobium sp. M1227]|uniref:helix-turn-helix domain-containing protein n=2 Tax=Mesorhizobium TaxID=68287 RepID=UPI003339C5AF
MAEKQRHLFDRKANFEHNVRHPQLRYAIAAADHGSFCRAARALDNWRYLLVPMHATATFPSPPAL